MDNKCRLCQENLATKTNSHIFPKFFKKEYLKRQKGFHYYNLNKKEVVKTVQDLPKEDYIFCPECEKRFQVLEYFGSTYLRDSYRNNKQSDYPKHRRYKDYQLAKKCNPKIFSLFIYSLIWRAHISTDKAFKDFKVPNNCEKDLRETLIRIVPTKISELNGNLEMLINQRWNYILLKPEKRNNNLHSIHYNSEVKKTGVAFIYAFEYAIFFVTNKRFAKLNNFKRYENKNFEELKFLQMKTELWNFMMMKTVQ